MAGTFIGSLRFRTVLLVCVAVLPLLGFMLHSAAELQRADLAQAEDELAGVTRFAVTQHSRLVRRAARFIDDLAASQQLGDTDASACSTVAARIIRREPNFANLGAIDSEGRLICSAVPYDQPINVSHRLYFQRALQDRGLVVGALQLGLVTEQITLNFAKPLLDENGRVQSVGFAALNLGWLDEFAADEELPEGSTITIVDKTGTLLAHYPEASQWIGLDVRVPLSCGRSWSRRRAPPSSQVSTASSGSTRSGRSLAYPRAPLAT